MSVFNLKVKDEEYILQHKRFYRVFYFSISVIIFLGMVRGQFDFIPALLCIFFLFLSGWNKRWSFSLNNKKIIKEKRIFTLVYQRRFFELQEVENFIYITFVAGKYDNTITGPASFRFSFYLNEGVEVVVDSGLNSKKFMQIAKEISKYLNKNIVFS